MLDARILSVGDLGVSPGERTHSIRLRPCSPYAQWPCTDCIVGTTHVMAMRYRTLMQNMPQPIAVRPRPMPPERALTVGTDELIDRAAGTVVWRGATGRAMP